MNIDLFEQKLETTNNRDITICDVLDILREMNEEIEQLKWDVENLQDLSKRIDKLENTDSLRYGTYYGT